MALVHIRYRKATFAACFWSRNAFHLRPTNTKSHYRLVSGCYIHGIMRGEAIRWWKDGLLIEQDILLV